LEGSPLHQAGVQDHSFHAQAIFDINKQVAKLETGLEHIEKRLEKVETKLDNVATDINNSENHRR
jgi:archaellum component FlaC